MCVSMCASQGVYLCVRGSEWDIISYLENMTNRAPPYCSSLHREKTKTERRPWQETDSPQNMNISWQKPQRNPVPSLCMFPRTLLSNSDQNTAAFYWNPRASLSCINLLSSKYFPGLKCQRRNSFSQSDTDTFIQKHLDTDQQTVTGECRYNKEIFHIVIEGEEHSSKFWVRGAIKGYITNLYGRTLQ